MLMRHIGSLFRLGTFFLAAATASAQDFPSKPIRIITGGSTSPATIAAREVAAGVSGPIGQQIVVDSRGSGVNTGEVVARSAPDGYTLVASGSGFWIETLTRKMSYDVTKDFAPVTLMTRSPFVLVVHPTLPVYSVKELVALAKARPGDLNYSIGGVGGAQHLIGELFKSMAGVNMVAVPYTSGSAELVDLLTGRIQLTFNNPAAMADHVKSGKLRILAVTSADRSPLVPGVSTVAASGVPGFEVGQVAGLFAPAKTPEVVVNRLNQEIVRFLRTPETKERFLRTGVESVGSSPEEFAALIKNEVERLTKVVNGLGLKRE